MHSHFILVSSFFQEFFQMETAARFNFFKSLTESRDASRDIKYILPGIENPVGRVEPQKLVVVRWFFAELPEERLEHIRHPIPAWPYVKCEALVVKFAGMAALRIIIFINGNVDT